MVLMHADINTRTDVDGWNHVLTCAPMLPGGVHLCSSGKDPQDNNPEPFYTKGRVDFKAGRNPP